jgi:hypothetical protein
MPMEYKSTFLREGWLVLTIIFHIHNHTGVASLLEKRQKKLCKIKMSTKKNLKINTYFS